MNDIIKMILKLPSTFRYEGIYFTLIIFKNGSEDLRIVYTLEGDCVDKNSPHFRYWKKHGLWKNQFEDGKSCDWLILQENISDELTMRKAVNRIRLFLAKLKIKTL